LIGKNPEIFDDATKISIMVNLPHEAGSLNGVLSRFSTLGLNLTKLESRPIPDSSFEFAFYFDFEGNVKNNDVQSIISDLDNTCQKFVFLGNYAEKRG
jgi:chorismate mutase/prephenate dehydratase